MDNRQSCQANYRPNMNANISMTPPVTRPMPKPSKKELMDKINECSFAVVEATEYLDTHPFDAEALAYFQKHRAQRVELLQEYAKYYAPLVIDYATCDKTPWSWANEPWPWEGVDC